MEEFHHLVGNRFILYHDQPPILLGSNFCHKSNYLSGGVPLSCDSLTHSDVRNYNSEIVNGELGSVAEGLWRSMTNLGITNITEEFDPIVRLEEMESKKSKGDSVRRKAENKVP